MHIHRLDSIAAAPLIKPLNAKKLLPVAFYQCYLEDDLGTWVSGITYGNETVCFSNDDLKTCLRGHSELEKENSRIFKTFLEFQAGDVLQPVKCIAREWCRKAVALLALAAAEDHLLNDASPLSCWDRWLDDMCSGNEERGPCNLCNKALRWTIDDRCEEVWQKLGKIFGVEPWPVVDANSSEVVGPHINLLCLYPAKSRSRNQLLVS